jgi:hypothetical protein
MVARNDGAYLYLFHIRKKVPTFFGSQEDVKQAELPPDPHNHPAITKEVR